MCFFDVSIDWLPGKPNDIVEQNFDTGAEM
jgi:hypothetical protein